MIDLPLVGDKEEEPALPVAGEGAVGVLANLIGNVEQNTCDVVGLPGNGAVEFGGARRGSRVFVEVELSCSGVVIALQKIVADTANVGAAFERVVTNNLGPVVGKVDVRLSTQPGQRRRVADQR